MKKKRTIQSASIVKISFSEGVFAQIFSSLSAPGSIFITKFAIFLGAGPFYFGLLTAIGQISQLFQPIGYIMTRKMPTRKPILVKMLLFSRAACLLFALLPFFFSGVQARIVFALLFFAITAVQAAAGNIWISWIADLIPERVRGRFFSYRTQFLMVTALLTGFVFSIFFDMFESQVGVFESFRKNVSLLSFFRKENLTAAFAVIFSLSALSGIVSALILSKQLEKPKKLYGERLKETLTSPFSDSNFLKLIIFATWFTLAIGVGSPFWAPFMIQKLKMNLFLIQIYGTVSVLASVISLRYWGRFIDRFGNKTTMRITVILGGINPFVWVFLNQNNFWIVYIEGITSGIMWSATNVIFTNFVLSISPQGKNQIYSGIFGAFTAAGIVISALLSGIFMPPAIKNAFVQIEPEQILFAATGFLRWTAEIPLSWVKEPRSKPLGFALLYMISSVKMKIINMGLLLRTFVSK
ncbi:MFS transporter [candidate division WOR-3 bacterium]|nr:MFS transporter [candidate division WOR-3 bacterium]